MANTLVCDHVLWAKRVSGDARLVDRILRMDEKDTIALVVDDIPGIWEKMANDANGRPTSGLKPVGAMKNVWGSLYRDRRGEVVDIRWGETGPASAPMSRIPIEPPLARTEVEREAAWNAFLSLAGKGWRSEGPYGPRDELYDR
jgi:hypothetical protein